jgi:pimeloyl-ACP methyl ester carboxylesterase
MVVGNDVGGTLVWTMAALHPRTVRSAVVLGAAHPLRWRAEIRPGAGSAQRRASGYLHPTFQVPRRAENLISRDSQWVRALYDRWTGPRWRGTPGYVTDVERYARAMRIHPVSFCAAEHYRWTVRSLFRPDGRRYADAMRTPITAPVLHLHGDFDTCVLPATAAGSGKYVTGRYEWRVLDGIGHFPHDEAPESLSGELIRWAKTA